MNKLISNDSFIKAEHSNISAEEIKEKCIEKAITTIGEIVTDNKRRLNGYKQDIQLLSEGIFYSNEYYEALKTAEKKPLLEFLKKKGSFFHGYASPNHFSMVPDRNKPSGCLPNRFVLKKGVLPSEGLDAMQHGLNVAKKTPCPSLIGCGEVCQIAYLEGIKEGIGTDKFDLLFAADSSTPLTIQFDDIKNPINKLINKQFSLQKFEKGQIAFFNNIAFYTVKHLNGDAGGFTTLCSDATPGKELFTALGLDSKGVSSAEVSDTLLNAFNSDPVGMEIMTVEISNKVLGGLEKQVVQLSKEHAGMKITQEEFKEAEGGKLLYSAELHFERITQLANTPLKEIRKLFDGWN